MFFFRPVLLFCLLAGSYRQYDESASEQVKNLYKLNHTYQTVDFVLQKRAEYSSPHCRMSIWEALKILESLEDESDPDLDLPQIQHCYQVAEALRKDGAPRWLILTGFIHDLGKVLALYREPQWAIVGDTFPVGCAWSEKIIFPEYFQLNPDKQIPEYQTRCGIYTPYCGLNHILMSWGHDEYIYQVLGKYLPKEASFILRYHSFYALHREGAYEYLLSEEDHNLLPWLQYFNKYDLYSKSPEPLNIEELRPYYEELVAEFFPSEIEW